MIVDKAYIAAASLLQVPKLASSQLVQVKLLQLLKKSLLDWNWKCGFISPLVLVLKMAQLFSAMYL